MDIQMIMTYIMIDVFCMIIALTMRRTINKDFGSEFEVKSIRKSIFCFCAFMIAGLIWLLMENGFLPRCTWVLWASNMISLFMLIAVTFYWFLFAASKVNNRILSTKWKVMIASVPLVIAGILCLTTPWTGWVFRITKEGVYTRGSLFLILSSMGFLYDFLVFFIAIIEGFHTDNKENRRQCIIIALYIVFPLSASLLQIRYAGMPILAPAIVTGYFLVFSDLQLAQINSDALTDLNNRRSAFRYLGEQIRNVSQKSPVVVYMMDLNFFKEINDNYGHVEGDHALWLFAETLKIVANDSSLFISRYGGDEFLVIGKQEDEEKAEQLVQEIQQTLKKVSIEDKRPYSITVSVGYRFAASSKMSAEDLIEEADQALYQAKQRDKRQIGK